MVGRRKITVGKDVYVLVATIDETQSLSFLAGTAIAVEKMDMRPGGTEFDYQVNSRGVRNGRPEDIMVMQNSLDREFMEARVKSNVYGLPVSIGNLMAMARGAPLELSYGELRPQVFTSKVTTDPVAWTIHFKRAYYSGVATRPSLSRPSGTAVDKLANQATTRADASASAGAATATGGARNRSAPGNVQPIGVDAVLRLYVRETDLSRYKPSSKIFGDHDMIFHSPGIFDWLQQLARSWR